MATSWFYAGPASSFLDLINSDDVNSKQKLQLGSVTCNPNTNVTAEGLTEPSPVKIFQIPSSSSVLDFTSSSPIELSPEEAQSKVGLDEQVMIFKYRGKFHAIEHQCPHRSYPLSRGSIHDIEDFGIVLSAGISCPKHGWSFDLFTGDSDRAGGYKLKVWDTEVRKVDAQDDGDGGIWVRRRRQRIG